MGLRWNISDRGGHLSPDEEAMRQQLSQRVVIEMAPRLAYLRAVVLEINPKRCPKWRFRLAEDVAMQLQPRPPIYGKSYLGPLFEGLVLQGAQIAREHFASAKARLGREFLEVPFEVYEQRPDEGEGWRVNINRVYFHAFERQLALKDQLIHGLRRVDQLDESMMFQPACLIGGKALTDLVSRARWIGPECARDYSLDVGLFPVNDATFTSITA